MCGCEAGSNQKLGNKTVGGSINLDINTSLCITFKYIGLSCTSNPAAVICRMLNAECID